MYTLNAFVQLSYFNDPTPNQISAIGELSSYSNTFSKTTNLYQSPISKGVDIIAFDSKLDDVSVELDGSKSAPLFEMIEWTAAQIIGDFLPPETEAMRQAINTQFADKLTVITLGELEGAKGKQFPSSMRIKLKDGSENSISLWFSDVAFQNEYPNFEIVPVMPFDDMDVLHGTRSEVLSQLDKINLAVVTQKINEATGTYPCTTFKTMTYTWYDKNDPSVTAPVILSVVIYGAKGQSDDLIKQALVKAILENSSKTRSDWEKILPDLFLPEEFYITPLWNEKSLPNLTTKTAAYSPTADIGLQLSYATSTFNGYDNDFIKQNVEHSVMTYRSLSFVALGNENNRSGIYKFSERWPLFNNMDMKKEIDYDRVGTETTNFILTLTEMVTIAERYPNAIVGVKYSVVDRGGNKYISTVIDNVQYLVAVYETEITPYFEDPNNSIKLGPDYRAYFNIVDASADSKGIVAHVEKREINSNNYGPVVDNTEIKFSTFIASDNGVLHSRVVERVLTTDTGIFTAIELTNTDFGNAADAKVIFTFEIDGKYYINKDLIPGV